jgi:isopentenyl diphosphate isomerase/L-lactate dehydrogenase-like FMN-dependent dehydrogenase
MRARRIKSVSVRVAWLVPPHAEADIMTRVTKKWIEDALDHIECAEYVKIPREQFIELVMAARNGMRPVLVHSDLRRKTGESRDQQASADLRPVHL